jgi:hypothetical protein
MGYFITPPASYHEGDPQYGDIVVPQRPDARSTWNGSAWLPEDQTAQAARIDAEALAAITTDKTVRTFFEAFFDLESRMRVIEAKPSITKVQYRNALLAIFKGMP